MRFDKGALALCLFAPLVSADFTWWADESCDGKISGGIDSMMEETIDMAKMIRDRMMVAEPDNLHPDRTYKTVFHEEPPIDPELEEDKDKDRRWERFAGMNGGFPLRPGIAEFSKEALTGEAGRKAAEVRIYCDNDKRFKPKENDESGRKPMNKEKPDNDATKEWVDEKDGFEHLGPLPCRTSSLYGSKWKTLMVTYTWNKFGYRSSITICDDYLNMEDRIDSLQGIRDQRDLGRHNDNVLEALRVSGVGTMFHEMHHIKRNGANDMGTVRKIKPEYGWDSIMRMNADDSMENADSHGIFGVLIWAMERKYVLSPGNAQAGTLAKLTTVPDRVPYVGPTVEAQAKRGLNRRRGEVKAVEYVA